MKIAFENVHTDTGTGNILRRVANPYSTSKKVLTKNGTKGTTNGGEPAPTAQQGAHHGATTGNHGGNDNDGDDTSRCRSQKTLD